VTPRAADVKAGRHSGGDTTHLLARPRLDGGEHGVKLAAVGLCQGLQGACGHPAPRARRCVPGTES